MFLKSYMGNMILRQGMEDYEKDRIVISMALLVIFVTVTLAILIYYGKI